MFFEKRIEPARKVTNTAKFLPPPRPFGDGLNRLCRGARRQISRVSARNMLEHERFMCQAGALLRTPDAAWPVSWWDGPKAADSCHNSAVRSERPHSFIERLFRESVPAGAFVRMFRQNFSADAAEHGLADPCQNQCHSLWEKLSHGALLRIAGMMP